MSILLEQLEVQSVIQPDSIMLIKDERSGFYQDYKINVYDFMSIKPTKSQAEVITGKWSFTDSPTFSGSHGISFTGASISSGQVGDFRYNNVTSTFEWYSSSLGWLSFVSGTNYVKSVSGNLVDNSNPQQPVINGIDIAPVTGIVDKPTWVFDANLGCQADVDRQSPQGYLAPSGNIEMMGADELLTTNQVDGKAFEIYGEGENLLTNPSDLTQVEWVEINSNYSSGALIEDSTTGEHFIYQSQNVTSGKEYTLSASVRREVGIRNVRLTFGGVFSNVIANFDLTNGVLWSDTGVVNAKIVDTGDGYRVSATALATASGANFFRVTILNESFIGNYQGDGVSSLGINNVQAEQSSIQTPFIDGVREACRVTEDFSKIFNYNRGTFVISCNGTNLPSSNAFIISMGSSFSNSMYINLTSGKQIQFGFVIAGTYYVCATNTPQENFKIVVCYESGNNIRISVGGVNVVEQSLPLTPTAESNLLAIGNDSWDSLTFYNNFIKSIKYYAGRTYTDEQMVGESEKL